ncbi:MAG: hypothetical protein IKI22_03120, partial [Neisseriaceae bacterium]|nr:hypothetical protein [Neisseriaceae bacterium]
LSVCGGGSDDSGTAQPNNNNSATNHYPSDSQTNNSQQSHDEQPQEQGSEAPFDMQMQAVVYKFQTDNNQDIISSSTSPIYQKHDGDSNDDSYKQMLINGKTVIFKETGNREDG